MTRDRTRQSGRSQFVDAVVLLALLFGTLFVTTWIVERFSAEGETGDDTAKVRKVENLPIAPEERKQYREMVDRGMVDEKTAGQQVSENAPSKDKYPINPIALVATAVLLVGYLGFVYRMSFTEYRQVIEKKFGRKDVPR